MSRVKAKKHLGQHFLKDRNVAEKITRTLTGDGYSDVIEVGPGTGALTRFLVGRGFRKLVAAEIDSESVRYLEQWKDERITIVEEDFLKMDLDNLFEDKFAVTGNFPYNISSQIFFKILENRHKVVEVTGMVQKEVALRIVSQPGTRVYGILSVLLGAFYDARLLFTVPPHLFVPPPAVNSAVIRLRRNSTTSLPCNEELFFRVVKSAFNQRRKMLRNALGAQFDTGGLPESLMSMRAEQLHVSDFVAITSQLE